MSGDGEVGVAVASLPSVTREADFTLDSVTLKEIEEINIYICGV